MCIRDRLYTFSRNHSSDEFASGGADALDLDGVISLGFRRCRCWRHSLRTAERLYGRRSSDDGAPKIHASVVDSSPAS